MKALPFHKDKRFQFALLVILSLEALVLVGKDIPAGILSVIELTTLGVIGQSKLGDFIRAKWGPKDPPAATPAPPVAQ